MGGESYDVDNDMEGIMEYRILGRTGLKISRLDEAFLTLKGEV